MKQTIAQNPELAAQHQQLVAMLVFANSLPRKAELDDMPKTRESAIAADTQAGEAQAVVHSALQELEIGSIAFGGDVDVTEFGGHDEARSFVDEQKQRSTRTTNRDTALV